MADFQPFNLGQVIQTAETIKGMRREGENDRIRNLYMGEQVDTMKSNRDINQAQEARAQTQFGQEQQVANTKLLNAAAAEVAQNPAAAERWLPQLQQAGVLDPNFDWRKVPPEKLQAAATQLYASTNAALQAMVSPDSKFSATEQQKNREQAFSNTKELADIQHKYALSEIDAKGKADTEKTAATNDHNQFRDTQMLRKEFEGSQAVKDYRLVLPLYERAKTAPNTRAGDTSIVYALGKMFDPGSVVREGELVLAKDAAPWLQKLVGNANSQLTGAGALQPEVRADIMQALKGQVTALEMPYNQERERFSRYAQENGWSPDQVVGAKTPGAAFGGDGAAADGGEQTATGPNGEKIVLRNGQWVPK